MLLDQGQLLRLRDELERLEGAGVVGPGLAEDAPELLGDCGLEVDVPTVVPFRLDDAADAVDRAGGPAAASPKDGGQLALRAALEREGDFVVAAEASPGEKSRTILDGLGGEAGCEA